MLCYYCSNALKIYIASLIEIVTEGNDSLLVTNILLSTRLSLIRCTRLSVLLAILPVTLNRPHFTSHVSADIHLPRRSSQRQIKYENRRQGIPISPVRRIQMICNDSASLSGGRSSFRRCAQRVLITPSRPTRRTIAERVIIVSHSRRVITYARVLDII